MEWLDRMRASIDYIEANLDSEIDFNEVSKKAFCSASNFHRMFSILTGVTAVEYVRRRRLTLAAQELMCEGTKVIDIALKYGYESPDAFTRAFQRVHGVSPSAARESGVQLVAYPRILQDMNRLIHLILKYTCREIWTAQIIVHRYGCPL
jgi:AraC family transcriptional regulator